MTAPTNRESDRFMLRLPDGMRDRIKEAATENSRSMNAEIVSRLAETFPPPTMMLEIGGKKHRVPDVLRHPAPTRGVEDADTAIAVVKVMNFIARAKRTGSDEADDLIATLKALMASSASDLDSYGPISNE